MVEVILASISFLVASITLLSAFLSRIPYKYRSKEAELELLQRKLEKQIELYYFLQKESEELKPKIEEVLEINRDNAIFHESDSREAEESIFKEQTYASSASSKNIVDEEKNTLNIVDEEKNTLENIDQITESALVENHRGGQRHLEDEPSRKKISDLETIVSMKYEMSRLNSSSREQRRARVFTMAFFLGVLVSLVYYNGSKANEASERLLDTTMGVLGGAGIATLLSWQNYKKRD